MEGRSRMAQTIERWKQAVGIGAAGMGAGAVAREMRRRAEANRMWGSFSRDTAREELVELECEFEAVWKVAIENYEGGEA